MGFQVVVDLDPPGVRDPVLISLGFVLAALAYGCACGAERASCVYAKKALSGGATQLKACAAAVTTSPKTLQARRR